jgi:hypothetical protein
MWLKLARNLEKEVYVETSVSVRLRLARAAEACYWQATGEAECNNLKDVIS